MSEREMSEQGGAQMTLGFVHGQEMGRDAIHIAVAQVEAAHHLAPGQHIGFVDAGQRKVGMVSNPLGIVDPFLRNAVVPGELFWMFLLPNTITGLRHQWTHPAFEDQPASYISHDDHKGKSLAWIKEHARCLGLTEDVLMEDAEHWLRYEDHKVQQGSERWRDNFNPLEFWHHYEIVTGKPVAEDFKQSFYCCTC
jgi:hypothetical protein